MLDFIDSPNEVFHEAKRWRSVNAHRVYLLPGMVGLAAQTLEEVVECQPSVRGGRCNGAWSLKPESCKNPLNMGSMLTNTDF